MIGLCSLPRLGLATDAESNASTEEGDDESHPDPDYFQRHAEGWFWYHDPVVAMKATPSKRVPPPPAPSLEPDDPVTQIERERKQLEVAMDRAILHPTPENMRSYLALNQQLMAQANDFSTAWKGTIWSNPNLDNTLNSPVGANAYIKADVDAAQQERQLGAAAQRYGLIFFFRGECPYCHKFAPILKQFAGRYGFSLVDVSLDGGGLPEFPHPQTNAQAATALKVAAVPAVYLVDPMTRKVVPATFGLVGWTELAQRITYAVDHAGDGDGRDGGDPHGSDTPSLVSLGGTQ